MLGISRSLIYQMVAEGQIASKKFGAVTVIPHDELQRFLDSVEPSPATKAAQASIK
ncbi:helix-turn-helix domain-containing protein [Methylobacterium persicinum]